MVDCDYTMRKRAALIITSLLLLCPFHLAAQEQERVPEYKARVRLVEITLQVKNSEGRHITDLQAEELSINAGGRERNLRVFQSVTLGLERFGKLKPLGVEYNHEGESSIKTPPRYYLLLFHQIQFRFGSFQRAKAAAMEFVRERMLPDDYVSVVGFDKYLDFELDFTNDKDKVLEAIEEMHLKHRNVDMVDGFFGYLRKLSLRFARMPHKVTIILIAEGMQGIHGPAAFDIYDDAIRRLQAADVRIFGIDAGGLNFKDPGAAIAKVPMALAAKVYQSFNLGLWSGPTGGRYFRYHNNIVDLFEQVDYEMSAYYLIGFYLDEDEEVDKPISIKITCSRPGARLLYKTSFSGILDLENEEVTRIFHKIRPSGGLFFRISLLRPLPAPRRGVTTSAGPKSPAPRPSKKLLRRRQPVIIHPCRISFKCRRLNHFKRLPVKSCEISGLIESVEEVVSPASPGRRLEENPGPALNSP